MISEYRKLVTEFFERYEKPVVEELIEGFSGIDPQKKSSAAILDHEQLNGLLGGEDAGHYHLTKQQLDWIREQMTESYPPVIMSGQVINITANEEMTPYEIQSVNTTN